ncbi:hypothetical protein CC1G_04663 [Coprinopsis cinerea okayama7|uniref:MYND-type domain-containing protein n=1 Tax=Coprinopsis cinerea (strain Okayama-7 / 130 / ATCC MYA-4618 / FGSC 9003) TaxID=240176 RepID=A8N556_COPC7|nr:hypothetical protein CC1G_04663 [Coprinopsis cinerea okayama7\|eukprot:XP_001829974.1 hypothetical protein CC1G_04663 [Coprinopsis cinerea okayama7\
MANPTADTLLNVTVESLATFSGVGDPSYDYDGKNERGGAAVLKAQLGILQQKPRPVQFAIHHELAAKYTPALVEKFKADTSVLGAPARLLNVISYTPYFVRFTKTPAGKDITSIFASRIAQLSDNNTFPLSQDEIAEIGQFFATLVVLQGQNGISEDDKKALLTRFKSWLRDSFAGDTSERCLAVLNASREMQPMFDSIKHNLEGPLNKCGGPQCQKTTRTDGASLLKCSKCKTSVYCDTDHQREAWPEHKRLCFPATF